MQIHIILSNLRSVYNVGSLFRTADAAGVVHMYLVGTTPAPIDRFGRLRKDMHKTALGAQEVIPWTYYGALEDCTRELKQQGLTIVAVEQDSTSISYTDIPLGNDLALVLGEETQGLTTQELSLCDHIAEIPQYGEKESLNVSVAGGVVMFDIKRRLQ